MTVFSHSVLICELHNGDVAHQNNKVVLSSILSLTSAQGKVVAGHFFCFRKLL